MISLNLSRIMMHTCAVLAGLMALQASAQDRRPAPIREARRCSVVEEYTGTRCGYCTRGHAGMERLRRQFGDSFIGIALHQYNATDPMYITNYAHMAFEGAPNCTVNRGAFVDPLWGHDYQGAGIVDVFEAANSVAPSVDVTLTAEWADDGQTQVSCTAVVEPLTDSSPRYTVAFVLVADSLRGEGSAWQQYNYYASTAPTAANEDLAPYCSGGRYGQTNVSRAFNDVCIASSYAGNLNLARFPSGTSFECGVPVTSTYTLKLPTQNDELMKAVRAGHVYAVVMVFGSGNTVANARKVPISPAASGIAEPSVRTVSEVVGRYGLDGRRVAPGHRGLQVVRLSDGRSMKYVEK